MIQTENLTKRFGAKTVVDDVSFRVEPGTVTGFLGANGAGKTTTLRLLTGLSQPDGGQAIVLGGRYRDLPNPGRRVGVLLDAAAQHGGRRGREALAVSAQLMGVDQRRASELLDLVGLDRSAAKKRVRHYSLGMRQRLGIAHALLGDPEVLILDEPANGLDPPGSAGCASFCATSPTAAGPSCCPRTSYTRCRRSPTGRDHRPRPHRRPGEPRRAACRLRHGRAWRRRRAASFGSRNAGLEARPAIDGGFVVEAQPDVVGRAALAGGVALSRLAPADGSGLEQLFFDLTAGSSNGARADPVEVTA